MVYATKRQRFLVDQGYSFHVVTNLVNEQTPNLKYSEPAERRELLMQVLTLIKSGNKLAEQDSSTRDDDDGVERSNRSMASLSGAADVEYTEFSSQSALSSAHGLLNRVGSAGRGRGRGKRKANSKFMQKEHKRRKTLKERREQYLPH